MARPLVALLVLAWAALAGDIPLRAFFDPVTPAFGMRVLTREQFRKLNGAETLWARGIDPERYFDPPGKRQLQEDEIGQITDVLNQYRSLSSTGDLFHGPAFQLMKRGETSDCGASTRIAWNRSPMRARTGTVTSPRCPRAFSSSRVSSTSTV